MQEAKLVEDEGSVTLRMAYKSSKLNTLLLKMSDPKHLHPVHRKPNPVQMHHREEFTAFRASKLEARKRNWDKKISPKFQILKNKPLLNPRNSKSSIPTVLSGKRGNRGSLQAEVLGMEMSRRALQSFRFDHSRTRLVFGG